jgi:hypothetical protein
MSMNPEKRKEIAARAAASRQQPKTQASGCKINGPACEAVAKIVKQKTLVKLPCGHEFPPQNLPKCGACRDKDRKAKNEKNRAKMAAKLAAGQGNPEKDGQHKLKGRLPDKAKYICDYDSEAQEWSGTLYVSGQTFMAKASGLFRLEKQLDEQYRAWLASTRAEMAELAS